MGKKGLSREEKLEKVQELLHECKTAMTLKELEKKASSEKGVVSNTVKEIVDELIADGLVCQDKIGTSNYYWSFPSQGLIVRRRKQETFEASIANRKRRRDEVEQQRAALDAEREENGGERDDKLKRLNAMREEEAAVDAELTLLRANDPELLQALRDDVAEAQQAVERWTDNLATLRDFARDTLNFDNAQFDANFGCEGICE